MVKHGILMVFVAEEESDVIGAVLDDAEVVLALAYGRAPLEALELVLADA